MGFRASLFLVLLCLPALVARPLPGQQKKPEKSTRKNTTPENPYRILERIKIPEVYCTRCIREKRIKAKRKAFRLMEQDGQNVIADLKKPVYYLEWKHIKFVSQIPAVNLAVEMQPKNEQERENWKYLKLEIEDLKSLFPRARVGPLNPHQMAHLMMNRMIRFYLRFEKEMEFWKAVEGLNLPDYGMGPHLGMKGAYEMYVLKGKNHYLKWEDKFLGRKSIVGQKWHLFQDRVLVWTSYYYGNIKLFNNFLHHNFAHILFWGYRGWTFKLPGWIHVGFAHHVERSITKRFNTFCYDEGGEPPSIKGWKWELKVRKAVDAGRYTPMVELKPKIEMPEFNGMDHLVSWSVVKFMIEFDKKKFRDFVDLVSRPEQMPQEKALKQSYGWTFNLLEELWREHVVATYPKP